MNHKEQLTMTDLKERSYLKRQTSSLLEMVGGKPTQRKVLLLANISLSLNKANNVLDNSDSPEKERTEAQKSLGKINNAISLLSEQEITVDTVAEEFGIDLSTAEKTFNTAATPVEMPETGIPKLDWGLGSKGKLMKPQIPKRNKNFKNFKRNTGRRLN